MQGVSYHPVEMSFFFFFPTDAALRNHKLMKDELEFLKSIGLECFLTKVPWGVLHEALATEVILTFQKDGFTVLANGHKVPILHRHWRDQMLKVFELKAKGYSVVSHKWTLSELFPSITTLPRGMSNVKVNDCQCPCSKKPLGLLRSVFCLNATNQYPTSIEFATTILQALKGEAIDWPYEFYQELKDELIDLSQKAREDKAKVIKFVIGPHNTILTHAADKLNTCQATQEWFGTYLALSLFGTTAATQLETTRRRM